MDCECGTQIPQYVTVALAIFFLAISGIAVAFIRTIWREGP